jgi:pyruvate formate lyase activating enzyme
MSGVIFDIKKFSIHDGPGIRSTVFFKGCPLHCWWCHNPESQTRQPQLLLRPQRCLACGVCIEACSHGAIIWQNGTLTTDLSRCNTCGACVETCYAEARELVGRQVTVAEVLADIERDRPFYDESGGGVTFSGGEPLLQPAFLLALLQVCKARDLHTAVDTCGYARWATLNRIRPYVDLFLYDLKHLDDEQHHALTGVSNALILANLQRLAESGQTIIVRTPIIPGFNDNPDHIRRLGAFVAALPGVSRLDLLPYHAFARGKYGGLGLAYHLPEVKLPTGEDMQSLAEMLRGYEINVQIDG